MIPDNNLINAKVHEMLGHEICVESGVCYAFDGGEMKYLPDYCRDPAMTDRIKIYFEEGDSRHLLYQNIRAIVDAHGWPKRIALDDTQGLCRLYATAALIAKNQWPEHWETKEEEAT